MNASEQVATQLRELAQTAETLAVDHSDEIAALAELVATTLRAGRTLMFCGNGGSAADAQHLATEYVVRFHRNRAAAAALALTTDSSLLTAVGNDLGFELIFARQVEAIGRPGDLLFLHSTSGESENLIAAAHVAREHGVRTVALLARGGGRLRSVVDHALVLPTDNSARAQELQLAIGHLICDLVEAHLPLSR
ncbi:MAG TPA: SIS domain-containing protein [Longimicrobiales bacterium]|nr:SIS domain-containing protein [Longimicrobiales bacterium]